MYVTTRFIGTKCSEQNYLFFLLTVDYINGAEQIMSSLEPLLTNFARDLDGNALVIPFRGDENNTLDDALDKFQCHHDYQKSDLIDKLPAILAIDVDFDTFDPKQHNHILISLKDSISKYGHVAIFEVQELLNELVLGTRIHSLFQHIGDFLKNKQKENTWEVARNIVEIKPEIFGISIDIRKGIKLFKSVIKNKLSEVYGDQLDVYKNPYEWVKCPKCNISFKVYDKGVWDGEVHKTCGQRLNIL